MGHLGIERLNPYENGMGETNWLVLCDTIVGVNLIMYQNYKICCEEILSRLAKMSDKSFGEIDMAIKRVLVLIEPRNTEILFAF